MTELVYYRLHRDFEIAAPESTRLIDRSTGTSSVSNICTVLYVITTDLDAGVTRTAFHVNLLYLVPFLYVYVTHAPFISQTIYTSVPSINRPQLSVAISVSRSH